jgi:hypothetical protein
MRKDNVQKNDVQRQIAKIYLNCLWGKYAQSSIDSVNKNIYGYSQFSKIHFDPAINHSPLSFYSPAATFAKKLRHVAFHQFRTDFIHFYLHIYYLQPSIITTTIFRTKNAQETMEIDQIPNLPNNRPSFAKKFTPPDHIFNPK